MNIAKESCTKELVTKLILILSLVLQVQACIFGSGAECALPCRCSGAPPGTGSCDSVTGKCDTDSSCISQVVTNDFVGQNWSGDGCQTGNVALDKTGLVTETGVESNNVVDGLIGSGYACTTVDTGDIHVAASITVDLGGLYKVTEVLVYNTHDSAESGYLENFFVMQGTASATSTQGCSTYSSQVPQGGNSGRINCAPTTAVRYITIEKTDSALTKHRMTICEIAVYGHIYYNVDCSKCNSPEQCHTDLWCEQCTGGWSGHDCATAVVVTCPENCVCNQGAACSSCEQWYVDPDTDCNKHIRDVFLEGDSVPAVKSSTTTTLTVTFKQDDMSVDSGVEQYYYYVLQYKTAQDSSYTDGTSLIQHLTDLGFRAEREFIIDGLQKYTAYEIRLVIYRMQNGMKEELSVTLSRTGTTACSDRSKPTGVSATPGQESFTVQWTNLFYDPTCEHAEVDIYYTPVNNRRLPAEDVANNPGSYEVMNVQAESYNVFIRITYTINSTVVDSDTVSVTVTALTPATTPAPTTTTTTPATTSTTTTSTTQASIKSSTKSGIESSSTSQDSGTAATTTMKEGNADPVTDGGGSTAGIIGGVVAAIVIIAVIIIVLLFFLRRYKKKGNDGPFKNKKPIIHTPHRYEDMENGTSSFENAGYDTTEDKPLTAATVNQSTTPTSTLTDKPIATVSPIKKLQEYQQQTEEMYGNVGRPNTRVSIGELGNYIEKNYSTTDTGVNNTFHKEYKRIPVGEKAKSEASGRATVKDRYLNIHAYDHSRVVLDIINDDEDSDYINANFITGYNNKEKNYVATQGPKKESTGDFWRMIWILNTHRIVMITRLVENGKKKCELYWPESVGGVSKYSYITVKNISVEAFADYTVRIFNVQKEGESEIRTIRQLHFTSWTDKSIPEHSFPLLAFRRKVRYFDDDNKGPMIVHCSAGIGRTGTFIALDYLLEEAAAERSVDVYEFVCHMRSERMNMVQTLQQYQFIYSTLLDASKTGDTAIPSEQFTSDYADINEEQLLEQFNTLSQMKSGSPPFDCAGHNEENRPLNRDQDIVPTDKARPFLMRCEGNKNDYINAVFVVGFKKRYGCIATQMPLSTTVPDFWRLVWDHSSKTIVMLNHFNTETDSEDVNGALYWPDDDSPQQTYGPIEVELISEELIKPAISVRQFKVRNVLKEKEDPFTVSQFQFNKWPSTSTLPESEADFIDLLETVEKWQQTSGNGPIIAHCMNGSTRSGIFCAASYMIDRLKEEQFIDVFTTVRYVRLNRNQFIENIEQYTYLHKLAAEFMSHYDTYANFK